MIEITDALAADYPPEPANDDGYAIEVWREDRLGWFCVTVFTILGDEDFTKAYRSKSDALKFADRLRVDDPFGGGFIVDKAVTT